MAAGLLLRMRFFFLPFGLIKRRERTGAQTARVSCGVGRVFVGNGSAGAVVEKEKYLVLEWAVALLTKMTPTRPSAPFTSYDHDAST